MRDPVVVDGRPSVISMRHVAKCVRSHVDRTQENDGRKRVRILVFVTDELSRLPI